MISLRKESYFILKEIEVVKKLILAGGSKSLSVSVLTCLEILKDVIVLIGRLYHPNALLSQSPHNREDR